MERGRVTRERLPFKDITPVNLLLRLEGAMCGLFQIERMWEGLFLPTVAVATNGERAAPEIWVDTEVTPPFNLPSRQRRPCSPTPPRSGDWET